MSNAILDEGQLETMSSEDMATVRIYVSAASKRAVVAEEGDILAKNDIADNSKGTAGALCT